MLMMQRWQQRRGGQRGARERCACAELTAHRVDQVAGGVEAGHLEEVDHRRLDRDLGLRVAHLAHAVVDERVGVLHERAPGVAEPHLPQHLAQLRGRGGRAPQHRAVERLELVEGERALVDAALAVERVAVLLDALLDEEDAAEADLLLGQREPAARADLLLDLFVADALVEQEQLDHQLLLVADLPHAVPRHRLGAGVERRAVSRPSAESAACTGTGVRRWQSSCGRDRARLAPAASRSGSAPGGSTGA